MKVKLSTILVALLSFFLFTSFSVDYSTLPINSNDRVYFELPETHQGDEIVKHLAYTLRYREDCEQADWVAYMFTKKMTIKKFSRTNSFKVDPDVQTESAVPSDYTHSGYDKGHLAPCDDMCWSKVAESESFYMSNMSPQTHSFNAGVWKRLEGLIRKYAKTYDTIYVATGPILQNGLKTIGKNKVAVPEYFYKVVLVYKENDKRCIGFILPHKNSQKDLMAFAVPVDSVESRTGINFFALVPDNVQKQIESNVDTGEWIFK